jgi:nitrate/nitrite transport system substrate-binding protein
MLDSAHMLAPMPLAASLGLGGLARPLVTALNLSLNGNGITVAESLYQRMLEADLEAMGERPISARALKKVIDSDRRAGREPLVFAMVFPFSMHNYELRYWMASAGIDPDRDVRLVVVPPPQMGSSLREGRIVGYCVGEPWNSLAVREGIGRMLISGYELWNNKPEKVLGVSRDWAEAHPWTHQAVLRALINAACWLDAPEHREEAADILANPRYVGVDAEVVALSLPGAETAGQPPYSVSRFFAHAAGFPWRSHAVWILTQMYRWGQIEHVADIRAVVESVYRCDLYREVARELGLPAPLIDYKCEGEHTAEWTLREATQPIEMGADCFFDHQPFDPHAVPDDLQPFRKSTSLNCTTSGKRVGAPHQLGASDRDHPVCQSGSSSRQAR